MKKIIFIFCLLIAGNSFSQKNYVNIGTGAFFNSPMKDYKQLLGVSAEYGRYLKSGISIGVDFGYWSLSKDYEYNGLRVTCPIIEKELYSITASGGINYFYAYKDLLFEYTINTNILLKKDYYLCVGYCYQSGLGYSKAESFNLGINKDF
jgi:hypothetical protein